MTDTVTIVYVESWRPGSAHDYVKPRAGWLVTCTEHDYLGKDADGQPWAYSREADAKTVATRHRKAYHDD